MFQAFFTVRFRLGGYSSEASGKPTGPSPEAETARAWGFRHLARPLHFFPRPHSTAWPHLPCVAVGQLKDTTWGGRTAYRSLPSSLACTLFILTTVLDIQHVLRTQTTLWTQTLQS